MFYKVSGQNSLFHGCFSILHRISRLAVLFMLCVACFIIAFSGPVWSYENPDRVWVGTWSTAPQLVEQRNNPPEPGLSNNTLRQIMRVSIAGDSLRVKFSNKFSSSPITLKSVHFAVSAGNGIIEMSTAKILRFNGKTEVTMQPGTAVICDPFHFKLEARTDVAITIYFGETSADVTGHPGSRTTSYLLTGNKIAEVDFSEAVRTDHWYVINSIDVIAEKASAAIAVLGNSISDGRGSGTNKQNRWPDILAQRLQENPDTRHIAVLNMGIGGNCVLRDCLGPAAMDRFKRDIIEGTRVKWLIILEGINDIGGTRDAESAAKVADDLIAAYKQMIDSAHVVGIKVYGATLTPFAGSFYERPYRLDAWKKINEWIRTSGAFDAVIDLDAAVRDPDKPLMFLPAADTGDHLHPNETGHRMMGEAVDLELFK